ncbi:hypothetical protein CMI38_05115 [Candidatus Pacearchaeota archaeon]|nr:hypothetical protein [Candidatus Pacearchaeota archaeon]
MRFFIFRYFFPLFHVVDKWRGYINYSPSKSITENTGHLVSLFLPFRSGSSMMNAISWIFPWSFSIRGKHLNNMNTY